MPTTDMVVVMVDMVMVVDMADTDMDVNADPLMLTMDMEVMVDTVMDMVDTDMAVNQSSLIFIVPKNHKNNLFPTYQRKIQTASFYSLILHKLVIYTDIFLIKTLKTNVDDDILFKDCKRLHRREF